MTVSEPRLYLVVVDIKPGLAARTAIYAELKRSPHWCHYFEDAWIVVRPESTSALLDKLSGCLRRPKQDRLLVMPFSDEFGASLPEKAWRWIEARREQGYL